MQTKDLLGARYRLDQRIAVGGMGDVWAARDELLGRPVALKLLHPHLAADEDFRRRFRAEAKAAARLSHPGIVAVYDFGEDADAAYLAMELVDGEPLSAVIRRQGRLDSTETMSLVAQTADALAAAHREGLVHRDVKPANLLLRPDGRVKVTDFGIARAADTATLTLDGTVLGTVAYMSPEQVRGERATAASDVYSLGVVAYECLSGSRPYDSEESIAVALAHLHDPVPALPPHVPMGVRQLVLRMLHKDPGARPASAAVVAESARRLSASGDATWALSGLGGSSSDGLHRGAVGARGAALAASYEAEPRTQRFSRDQQHDALDGVTEAVPLAGLAEPQTVALTPRRPVVFRPVSPRRKWAPIAALSAGALGTALILAAAFPEGAAPAPARSTVAVPQLRSATLGAAEHRLAALGLRVSTGAGDPAPSDIVVGERPAAGTRVARGSAVLLTVRDPVVPRTAQTSTTVRPATTAPAQSPSAPAGPPGGGGPPGHGPDGPPGHGPDGPPGHGGGHH